MSTEKPICFVIMPFGGWFDRYFQEIYKPAIESADLEPVRTDGIYAAGNIIQNIWSLTKKAKIILADLTGRNPNVLYELGLAHAIGQKAVLITESAEDIPFDLKPLRHIVYDVHEPNWSGILNKKITLGLKETLADSTASILPAFMETKDLPSKATLSGHDKELLGIKNQLEVLNELVRKERRMGLLDSYSRGGLGFFSPRPLVAEAEFVENFTSSPSASIADKAKDK